jgi:hypothetical protein
MEVLQGLQRATTINIITHIIYLLRLNLYYIFFFFFIFIIFHLSHFLEIKRGFIIASINPVLNVPTPGFFFINFVILYFVIF